MVIKLPFGFVKIDLNLMVYLCVCTLPLLILKSEIKYHPLMEVIIAGEYIAQTKAKAIKKAAQAPIAQYAILF
ncbi:hypothetical protein [Moraxella caprae]|uniref:hypothetical protein n=1 Tax=Moraxella caprae TaxID=90240 RepID=UPI0011C04428|nr:hypothetical protein [Moraxella caprae]